MRTGGLFAGARALLAGGLALALALSVPPAPAAAARAAGAGADGAVTDKAAVKKKLAKVAKVTAKARASAARLASSRSELSEATDALDASKAGLARLERKRKRAAAKLEALAAGQARARAAAVAARDELAAMQADATTTPALAAQAESRCYLLRKVAVDRLLAYERAQQRMDGIDERERKLARKVRKQEKAVAAAVQAGGKWAFELEKSSSQVRTYEREADELLGALDGKLARVKKARAKAKAARKTRAEARGAGARSAGTWYDLVESVSDTEDALTFGAGADFKLDEDAFTRKWGEAIDAFYDEYAAIAGREVALRGYGAVMAARAYAHKIDPRLCAAVSIIESSGGLYCIKDHNAWGWGAVDSDPTSAPGWDSWEAGIEAWHAGVAGSTTGLATAESLDTFGEIYCSSPDWTAKVAEQMERIGELAG